VALKKLITLNSKIFIYILALASILNAKAIPDLNIKLIDGTDTSIHKLLEEGPLLIDFWATWCVPCKKVMKYLNQYHLNYEKQGFKVLMINTDTPRSLGKVKAYIKSQSYKFNVGLDPNKVIAKKLNGLVMPTLILVDRGGEIIWRHQGYLPGDEVEIKDRIEKLIN
jgi:thiol-disulfide isomerase/thioredoxin